MRAVECWVDVDEDLDGLIVSELGRVPSAPTITEAYGFDDDGELIVTSRRFDTDDHRPPALVLMGRSFVEQLDYVVSDPRWPTVSRVDRSSVPGEIFVTIATSDGDWTYQLCEVRWRDLSSPNGWTDCYLAKWPD